MKPTISVIVPALNEEEHLADAVEIVRQAAADRVEALEVIIVDDASTDQTGPIADRLAREDSRIRVVHNPRSMGLGYGYRTGVELASHEYVIMVPGDNETPVETIQTIIDNSRDCDLVITHVLNPQLRPLGRRVLSGLFVRLVSGITGLRLRYYNGNCSIRRQVLLEVPLDVNGHAYMAATLVRLLRRGHSYREIGVRLQPRQAGRSKAFKLTNIIGVAKTLGSLFWETRVSDRRPQRATLARPLPPVNSGPAE